MTIKNKRNMKKIKVKIPMYDYDVTWVEIESVQDKEKVFQEMKNLKCNKEGMDDVIDNIEKECMNGGSTFRNLDMKQFLVIIHPCKNEEMRRCVVNHEKRHIEDRLLQHCGVDDIEAAAYLAGYLSKYIY